METTCREPLFLPNPKPNPNSSLFQYSPQPSLGLLQNCMIISGGTLDASSIENLLLHCATALETNNTTISQQIMWVLNNIASPNGDPNQRLTSWFLKALINRLQYTSKLNTRSVPVLHMMTVTELAGYIDLTPWHRFGFSAASRAILKAVEGRSKIHIIDFGITHCMQWPTMIDALSKRPEGPPLQLRITVPTADHRPPVPPFLSVSIETIRQRLASFSQSRNIPFQLHVAADQSENPNPNPNPNDEALVINCHSSLRYVSNKDEFLEYIRYLNPDIVTISDEDADLDAPSLSARIMSCFNYLWIPFDVLETFLPKDSPQRDEYEADVGRKIENVIGFEGEGRIERTETGRRIEQRMKRAGFESMEFGEETVKEVKGLVDEHAGGWGVKEEDEMLVLTWKGHSSVFVMAWRPSEDHANMTYSDLN